MPRVNSIRIEGGSAFFEISGLTVAVDIIDIEVVLRFPFRVTTGTQGAKRVVASVRGPDGPRSLTLGALIMCPGRNQFVYLIKRGDILDYRRTNLIVGPKSICKHTQSSQRVCLSSNFKGVSWSRQAKRWRASIETRNKSRCLGLFESEEDAARAYDRAALKIFGSHAYQNFEK